MDVLKTLFFNYAKKYPFQLGLALATREHTSTNAKRIIKEAVNLFMYAENPAWIHILGDAREEVLQYAQAISKHVYHNTADHRRGIVYADTSIPFFTAKEKLNDIRPLTVVKQYRDFWQVTGHDLKPLYTLDHNTNLRLLRKPFSKWHYRGNYIGLIDLFSSELAEDVFVY